MPVLRVGEHESTLNGVRIHYTVRGSGPPLILHFGGPGLDARGWDHCAGLDECFTLVIIHPRGSGLSGTPDDGSYTLSDYAADVEALRQHLGLERPFLLGWSHGGMVAMHFASTYPKALAGLILLDTAACFDDFATDLEGAVREFSDQSWYEDSLAALKEEWAGNYADDEEMTGLWAREIKFYFRTFDEVAQAYHRRTSQFPLRIAPLRYFNEHEAPVMDLRPLLGGIDVPTLVLVGRHDFITTVSMAEDIVRRIRRSRLVILEESGHFALVEEPAKLKSAIREFAESPG